MGPSALSVVRPRRRGSGLADCAIGEKADLALEGVSAIRQNHLGPVHSRAESPDYRCGLIQQKLNIAAAARQGRAFRQ